MQMKYLFVIRDSLGKELYVLVAEAVSPEHAEHIASTHVLPSVSGKSYERLFLGLCVVSDPGSSSGCKGN